MSFVRRLCLAFVRWLQGPDWYEWHTSAEEREAEEARMEAWVDARIAEHDLHRANEEMVLNGDIPYYDVCDAVGDGHYHLVPAGYSPDSASMRQGAED